MGVVVSQSELTALRPAWKASGKRVAFASGHFDILHPGHIRLLEQARTLGDVLVVAIESDASVAEHDARAKGKDKSGRATGVKVTPAAERAEILAGLAAVDYVVEFSETPPDGLVLRLLPDIVIKGGTAGSDEMEFLKDIEMEEAGSKVVRLPLEPGYSAAGLIERITQIHA